MRLGAILVAFLPFTLLFAQAPPVAEPLFDAIRHNDAAAVKRLLAAGAKAGVRDSSNTPAIMEAARFAGIECIRLLLDAGADPNAATDSGATALMWVIPNLEKAKLLVAHGADVNAASTNLGRTPLLIAASYPGTVDLLRFLLSKGANLRAKDRRDTHALGMAVRSSGVDVVRFLVESGISADEPESNGQTVLRRALVRRYLPTVDYLLSKGATVRKDHLALATPWLDAKHIAALIEKGADVNARAANTTRTPLNMAASADEADPAVLQLLLEKGADPSIAGADGETALDWALHRADSSRVGLLRKHGAKEAATPRDAVFPAPAGIADARTALSRSLALLVPTGPVTFTRRGCITCHNQTLPAQAAAAARAKGIAIDEAAARKNFQQIVASYKPIGEEAMQGSDPAGQELTLGYVAMALAAEKHPADRITTGLSHMVAARQMPEGNWIEFETRPPMEYSSVSRTVMAVRVLTLYPIESRRTEIEERLKRAARWLVSVRPASAEESAMRLMGLAWTKASRGEIDRSTQTWIAQQRPDGGWAQLPHLQSDAYATGITLFALHEAGIPATHASYRKGIDFLLKNQHADGSWFVKTRAYPVQPPMESGYPFGYHQWISSAAASWASLAIAYSLP